MNGLPEVDVQPLDPLQLDLHNLLLLLGGGDGFFLFPSLLFLPEELLHPLEKRWFGLVLVGCLFLLVPLINLLLDSMLWIESLPFIEIDGFLWFDDLLEHRSVESFEEVLNEPLGLWELEDSEYYLGVDGGGLYVLSVTPVLEDSIEEQAQLGVLVSCVNLGQYFANEGSMDYCRAPQDSVPGQGRTSSWQQGDG